MLVPLSTMIVVVRLLPEAGVGATPTVVVELLFSKMVSVPVTVRDVELGNEVRSDQALETLDAVGFKVDPPDKKQNVGVLSITHVVTDTAPPGMGKTFET